MRNEGDAEGTIDNCAERARQAEICAGVAARTESVITSLRLMSERARLMSTSHFSADGRLTFVRHACIDLVSCIARASASSRFCSAAAEMRSMVA